MLMGTIELATAVPVENNIAFLTFANECRDSANLGQDNRVIDPDADPDALFDLGMMYASGRAGCVDLVAAHKWFNLAAVKGRVDAIVLRREIAEQMSADDIAIAQREARAWMTAH